MAAFTRLLFVIFLLGLVYEAASTQPCNGPRQLPNHGKMLKRHIYETRKARSGHAECLFVCREKNVCQSFNFVMAKSVCEFNNRTKEASPKDFVDDPDRYYVKLDVSRVPLGSISELPAKSCKEINDNEGQKMADGKYWFHSLIPGKSVLAPCDMVNEDIDECNASPKVCTNGDCRNYIGSYDCSNCKSGFAGNGKSCNDVNECVSNPCKNGATCINTHGSYQCNCTSNFTGTHCDQDVNECSVSNPCKNGGTCTNTHGGYQCTCSSSSGFTGKHCDQDIDECASNLHDCNVNAYCTNTPGSFSCSCKPAYHGDGKRCVYAPALNESTILGNDSRYVGNLTSYLEPVVQNSSRSMFRRCWHAKNDGWAASTFHSNCDDKGPTVTIIQVGSYIFGGYTDVSWFCSSCSYAWSNKTFIFSLHNINGYNPVKLVIRSSASYAVYSCSSYGPTFGNGWDIYISDNAANNKNSYTYCGHSYPLPSGYSSSGSACRFYAGGSSYSFTPTDIEVFYETTT